MSKRIDRPANDGEQSISPRWGWTCLTLLIAVQALLGAFYILRTSLSLGNDRVFVLWDDAMISMQYARNLAEGHGLLWSIDGGRIEGFSNLGVTLVMALIHAFPVDLRWSSLVVQSLNLVTLIGMALLAQRTVEMEFDGNRRLGLMAAAAIALCFPMMIFSLQGSDTGFVGLWLLSSLWVYRQREASHPWSLALFALLSLGLVLRLDSAVLIAPFLALACRSVTRFRRHLLVGTGLLGLVVLGILLFQWSYFGDPLPNTYYLKAFGQPRGQMLWFGTRQLLVWLPFALPALGCAAYAIRRHARRPLVQLCAGCFATSVAYHLWVGGDLQPFYGSRFLIPAIPLLLILSAIGIHDGVEVAFRRTPLGLRFAIATMSFAAVALLSNGPTADREILGRGSDTFLKSYNERNLASALYYRAHTDASTTIGLDWAGLIAYFADRPVRDLLGKSEPHIAHMEVDRFRPGHSKWDWDYVLHAMRPDIIDQESRGLLQRADFQELYVRAQPAHAPFFFVRRDKVDLLDRRDLTLTDLAPSASD
jgi:hypothetical protein